MHLSFFFSSFFRISECNLILPLYADVAPNVHCTMMQAILEAWSGERSFLRRQRHLRRRRRLPPRWYKPLSHRHLIHSRTLMEGTADPSEMGVRYHQCHQRPPLSSVGRLGQGKLAPAIYAQFMLTQKLNTVRTVGWFQMIPTWHHCIAGRYCY